MTIRKQPDGRWLLDFRPDGVRRVRKLFRLKMDAEAARQKVLAKLASGESLQVDRRRLRDLVERWFHLHGVSLADGVRRKAILLALADAVGNPVASKLSPAAVAAYRSACLADGVSGKTLNNRLAYLRAMFSTLHGLDEIIYADPLAKLPALKLQERPLSYLSLPQIDELLAALRDRSATSPHPYMVARVCLATGCRWSEAEALTPDAVRSGVVVFSNTKGRRVRAVPVSDDLSRELLDHWERHGLFTHCMETFRRVLLSTSIRLPAGQASHVLRHTFASHFVMRGGNIVVLQKILGHASLTMTLRYAHLAPDHLQAAVALNPLALDTFRTLSES